MIDITKCRDLIPKKYLETHDYEEDDIPVVKNIVYIGEDNHIPLDLAFVRWMAIDRGVVMMPGSLFFNKHSPYRTDKYVRLAICKGYDHTVKAISRFMGKLKVE